MNFTEGFQSVATFNFPPKSSEYQDSSIMAYWDTLLWEGFL